MKKLSSRWVALLSLAAGLSASFGASADWTFNASGASVLYNPNAGYGGDPTVTVSGAYAANGGTLTAGALGTTIVAGNTYGINGFAAGAAWTVNSSSTLQYYSGNGLGMSSDSTSSQQPNHALDNGVATNASDVISGIGNTEAVMLSFSSSVVLSSIGFNWNNGDIDISVFRYTGSVAPTLNGTAASLSGMQAAGWSLVGNYANLVNDTTNAYNMINNCTNPSGTTASCSTSSSGGSSWWLITAYNSAYGAGTNLDQGNDYFKIYAVAGSKCVTGSGGNASNCGTTTNKVPEPGSLALVSVGLVGALGWRRRTLASRA